MKIIASVIAAAAILAAPAAIAGPVSADQEIRRATSLMGQVQDRQARAEIGLMIDQATDAAREHADYQAYLTANRAIEKAQREIAQGGGRPQLSQR